MVCFVCFALLCFATFSLSSINIGLDWTGHFMMPAAPVTPNSKNPLRGAVEILSVSTHIWRYLRWTPHFGFVNGQRGTKCMLESLLPLIQVKPYILVHSLLCLCHFNPFHFISYLLTLVSFRRWGWGTVCKIWPVRRIVCIIAP